MGTTSLNINLDAAVKIQAEKTFAAFGLNLSDAINVFLHKSIMEHGFPFEVRGKTPNAEFQAAIDECDAMVKGLLPMPPTMSVDDFFESMKGWTDDEL